jgi:hypothetical protein
MAIRCPYCDKKLKGVKAVYGHWAFCEAYKEFVKKHGKEARLPFKWISYTRRRPRNWVNRNVASKSVGGRDVTHASTDRTTRPPNRMNVADDRAAI